MDEDRDVIRSQVTSAYGWFRSFFPENEWISRRETIRRQLRANRAPRQVPFVPEDFRSVSVPDDRIGWYLYLAEMFIAEPMSYEPIQGARVIPLFAQIGKHLNLLHGVGNIQQRVQEIVRQERQAADQGLFEILAALLYRRNGWPIVEFVARTRSRKTPDLLVQDSERRFYVECKRFFNRPEYSQRERKKWLRLWQPLARFIFENRLPLVLDFTFHVELDSLPDTFAFEQLAGKLGLVSPPCTPIDNDTWTVKLDLVDTTRIERHLRQFMVREPSDQLNELILGRRDVNAGTTCMFLGHGGTMGPPTGTNRYVDEIEFAAGALWRCDCEKAISAKAKDIRRHLAEAIEQIPPNQPAVVHIGLETLDGWPVEQQRYLRICETAAMFDARGKDLQWIYCHLFQPYSPPEQDWVFDETVYHFGRDGLASPAPILEVSMVIPENQGRSGVHWGPLAS